MSQPALKYDVQVTELGRIEIDVPFPPGARLTLFIVPGPTDSFADLISSAESSLEFWDNPFDDEDWNDA
jgi:hypothetical protein